MTTDACRVHSALVPRAVMALHGVYVVLGATCCTLLQDVYVVLWCNMSYFVARCVRKRSARHVQWRHSCRLGAESFSTLVRRRCGMHGTACAVSCDCSAVATHFDSLGSLRLS